ncbi:MAG: cation-translocating P-type ATPase [Gammaproteobacteria bacterium]|nr:cation-translocating P-type ATPase [Gammaproteobacteria bacterium]
MPPSSTPEVIHWHTLETTAVLTRLGSDGAAGLSSKEAAARLAQYGPNLLVEGRSRSLPLLFLGQFSDFMILVLVGAAVVSGIIGEPQDAIAILVILLLNAIIGSAQAYRAERAVAALRHMAAPDALVVRDGERLRVAASLLVPGDLVVLEAGNLVPADLRLLEAIEVECDESVLTGESHPVAKRIGRLAEAELSLGDRHNLLFKGSSVTRGRGSGVVVATGMQTEFGRIAQLLAEERGVKTPLQQRLTVFGRYLALAVLAICAVVFVSGLLQGQELVLMFLTAVSLAVAAIPEALPAVVTLSLAFGARKLSRKQSLVRNLPAVETLGSVTYICADKTGTLTQNRMAVERLVVAGEVYEALPMGAESALWRDLTQALALSNDVGLQGEDLVGDPTEVALYRVAAQAGYEKGALLAQMPRLAELPFDSTRKLMTTLHREEGGVVAYVKGAPEALLPLCAGEGDGGGAVLAQAEALAAQGYRLLALAQRRFAALPHSLAEAEQGLTLLGLVALIDPPRPEAEAAVAECRGAGITPVMITGDHPGTALAIATRLGIAGPGAEVITGEQLAELSDEVFAARVKGVSVYARVSPEQKIRIVRALQEQGEFVAMTGDGVNDAPALKRAGIGIAMGQKGTDVARQAADMVLLDDNFATIVTAVREGRRIFDNIRKFIKDTMSSNSGEIWTLFLAPFLGLPIPLLPIHILWINLVTDGLPGLAFSAERGEPGSMQRPPRHPDESIFAHGMWQHIIWVGLFVGGLSIATQAWAISRGTEYWQTMVFTVLTFSQLFHSLAVRSERTSLWRLGLTSNLPMLAAVGLTVCLQLAVIYLPAFNAIFKTEPLPLHELLFCVAISSLVLLAVEVEKLLRRRGLLYGEAAMQ